MVKCGPVLVVVARDVPGYKVRSSHASKNTAVSELIVGCNFSLGMRPAWLALLQNVDDHPHWRMQAYVMGTLIAQPPQFHPESQSSATTVLGHNYLRLFHCTFLRSLNTYKQVL